MWMARQLVQMKDAMKKNWLPIASSLRHRAHGELARNDPHAVCAARWQTAVWPGGRRPQRPRIPAQVEALPADPGYVETERVQLRNGGGVVTHINTGWCGRVPLD
jgi:hypothetical protein